MWLILALLSAVFAALTSILAKIGIEGVNSNLATAIRTLFVVAMVLILVTAVTVGAFQFVKTSGIREKNTTAVTIGSQELSNAELNYYYVDAVNNFYSTNGQYASFFGLDTSVPLDEQIFDETAGQTWADYFVESAKSTATVR